MVMGGAATHPEMCILLNHVDLTFCLEWQVCT
jgi:hypothetical protein